MPPKRRATYEDLLSLPENTVGEILDGELFASPRPAAPHAVAASTLGSDLNSRFHWPPGGHEPGGWWILDEPELHLGPDVLVPDVAGWRRERMAELPDTAAFTRVPDWLCEVVSPSTGAIDRGRKMRIYAREGVRHLWIVDPLLRTLEVYGLESGRWVVLAMHGGDEPIRVEPFEAVELQPLRWWSRRSTLTPAG